MKFGKFPSGPFGSKGEKVKPLGTPEYMNTPELGMLGVSVYKVVTPDSIVPVVRVQYEGREPISIMPLGRGSSFTEDGHETIESHERSQDELAKEVAERLTKVAQETNDPEAVLTEAQKINGEELGRIAE